MANRRFFEESSEQSRVKSIIVSKYFKAWAKVMIGAQRRFPGKADGKIVYVDLFAGPGRYKDGTTSTPLLVLEMAIGDDQIRKRLITIFNDKDKGSASSLMQEIKKLSGIETLKYVPQIHTMEVGADIVDIFQKTKSIPTLSFIDPWGYKGLSLQLVNSVVKDWGCDCIIFFNYNRINMGLCNELVKPHMDSLFGEERVDVLRKRLLSLPSKKREATITEEICEALVEMGGKYILPFRFKNNRGMRTSHHLIFVSKNFKGYEIMKEIMAKESSATKQGVPSFEYNPADERQPFLFELSRPLDGLEELLLDDFAGQKLSMQNIYKQHSIDKLFIKSNYKQILLKLESTGRIKTFPKKRRKGTFGDTVSVTFPKKI